MQVLIAYGTSEGQTRKIAQFVADRLTAAGDEVALVDVTKLPRHFDLSRYDAAIIAARVHAGAYQSAVKRLVRGNLQALAAMPNAFLSVSMSAAGHVPGDPERVAAYAKGLTARTGWTPEQVHHIPGARKYASHNALGRWILGIVDRHRYDTSRDHEFTDWMAVAALADRLHTDFARRAPATGS